MAECSDIWKAFNIFFSNKTDWEQNFSVIKNITHVFECCGGGRGLLTKPCPTLVTQWTIACQAPLSMDFPGKNTAMSCHFLLQWIFLTQGSNPGLLYCRQILYQLSHQGSPYLRQYLLNLVLILYQAVSISKYSKTVYCEISKIICSNRT